MSCKTLDPVVYSEAMPTPVSPVAVPVFVIAFRDQAARRRIRERLVPLGVNPRFSDAVPGKTMTEDQRRPFVDSGREYWFKGPLRDGAMGCSLAHFGAWQTILDEGIDAAVVLEDDAVPSAAGLRTMAERLNALHRMRNRLDLVFLHKRWNRPFVRVDGGREEEAGLIAPCHSDLDALSYFITARCAEYLLSKPDRFRTEVDKYMHHWWRHDPDFHALVHWPPLFEQEGRPSQIGGYDEEPLYDSNPPHQVVVRRLRRLLESVRKRALFRHRVARIRKRL